MSRRNSHSATDFVRGIFAAGVRCAVFFSLLALGVSFIKSFLLNGDPATPITIPSLILLLLVALQAGFVIGIVSEASIRLVRPIGSRSRQIQMAAAVGAGVGVLTALIIKVSPGWSLRTLTSVDAVAFCLQYAVMSAVVLAFEHRQRGVSS